MKKETIKLLNSILTEKYDFNEKKFCPKSISDYYATMALDKDIFIFEFNFGVWSEQEDKTLLLFPYHWLRSIPIGCKLVGLLDHEFINDGNLSEDTRYGFLAFGIFK